MTSIVLMIMVVVVDGEDHCDDDFLTMKAKVLLGCQSRI